jgi:hypothetical protein
MMESMFDCFETECARCGSHLVLDSYRLAHRGRGERRRPQVEIDICGDGFAVCDDLWGTPYEEGDQSTDGEVTRCTECGRLADLLCERQKTVTVREDILRDALRLLENRPPSKRETLRAGFDLRETIVEDLKVILSSDKS